MRVFKFGGASVKDAESVERLGKIVQQEDKPLLVVVSAMGKMTNAFERMLKASLGHKSDHSLFLDEIKQFHLTLTKELFRVPENPAVELIENEIERISEILLRYKRSEAAFDFLYDQIVSGGEFLSTRIVSLYLNHMNINNDWTDAGDCIVTNNLYRRAGIHWDKTEVKISGMWKERNNDIVITQGFIGKNEEGHYTTLGREGSDFTAAIFGNCLEADDVTIWKDVPGILNADPKFFNNTVKLDHISFHEAVELAYYGATVIHPKTIKPLENKNIPLFVKSFLNFEEEGTRIDESIDKDALVPSYIFMKNQVLISLSARDYSFIVEENLSHIFGIFAHYGVKINLMQNSALSFSACMAFEHPYIDEVISELKKSYKVLYNTDLELLTIRHYDQKTIDHLTENKEILVSQKSRHTARLVMRNDQ